MTSPYGLLLGIYAAGALVGLVCWLPYYLSNRRYLRSLLDQHREQYDVGVDLHGDLVQTAKECDRAATRIGALEGEGRTLRGSIKSLEANVKTLHGEKLGLSNEIGLLRRRLDETAANLSTARSQLTKLEAEMARNETQWLAEKSSLSAALAQAMANVESLTAERDALQAKVAALEAAQAQATATVESLTRERDSLRSQKAGLEEETRKDKNAIKTLDARLAELQAAGETLDANHRQLTLDIAALNERLAEAHAQRDLVQAKHANLDAESKAALAAWDAERVSLQQQIDDAKRQTGELQTQLGDHANALTEKNSQILTLNQKIGILSLEVAAKTQATLNEAQQDAIAKFKEKNGKKSNGPDVIQTPGVTIGLDFGTYSTKVVFRGHGEANRSWVLRWDEPAAGYPEFASPSLVRVDEKKIYFGSAALRCREGKLFRSLKLDLLPVDAPKNVADEDWLAPVLVVLYLGWVLKEVQGILKIDSSKIHLNVGAPMKRGADAALRDRYLRVVHAAWELAFGEDPAPIHQEMTLEDLSSRVRELLDRDVPDLTERRFDVFEETICPIVSLASDPSQWNSNAMLMVVDMGAGTTEISINSTADLHNSEYPIKCYDDGSFLLGGDRFDAIDSNPAIKMHDVADAEKALVAELHKHLTQVWHQGFGKCNPAIPSERDLWNALHIVKVGGGLRRRRVNQSLDDLTQPPSLNTLLDPKRKCHSTWFEPTELSRWDEPTPIPAQDLSLLAVAHGLSIQRMKRPRHLIPDEIATPARAETVSEKLGERRYHE